MTHAEPVGLTVQVDEGKPISPDLVGVFFEDLNYAADGGIYAELVQNRSFQYSPTEQPDWHPLKFWDLEQRGDGSGSLTVADMRPIHPNNTLYAILTVNTPGRRGGDCEWWIRWHSRQERGLLQRIVLGLSGVYGSDVGTGR